MIISEMDQNKLDKFCYFLYEREKVNRLRHAEYSKANRLRNKLGVSLYGWDRSHTFSPKMEEQLANMSLDDQIKMMKRLSEHANNYRILGKFLKSKRKEFTTMRKKALMEVNWDGANNFRGIRIQQGFYNTDDYNRGQVYLYRSEVIKRAENYIMEKYLLGAKRIINPYSLKKVEVSNECKRRIKRK
jgi:hypothetical protein